MRSPRKTTRPSQTPVVLYDRDIKRMKGEVFDKTMTLVLGYLMDDLDYDEDRIIETIEGIMRYGEAIADHTITLRRVKEIIQDKTGLKLLGWK